MAILVTRPEPDNAKTAAALRARGYEPLLSPMLRYEAIPFQGGGEAAYDGVVITSANAIRVIENHPSRRHLFGVRAFAVGEATAEAARSAGFGDVVSAKTGAKALGDLIVKNAAAGKLKPVLRRIGSKQNIVDDQIVPFRRQPGHGAPHAAHQLRP